MARLCFCQGIGKVAVAVDPFDFHDLPSLVGLPEAHYVNHQTFLLDGVEFDQIIV